MLLNRIIKEIRKTALVVPSIAVILLFSASTGQTMTYCDNEVNMSSSGMELSSLPQLSEEELKWFNKFMEGTIILDGWKDITKKILADTPQNQRHQQRQLLESLGIKIGMEWSRDNTIRRIDTGQLREWGRDLKATARKQPERLSELIVSIGREVDYLLN